MMIHRAETGVWLKPPRIRWLACALGMVALVSASSAEAVTGTGTLSADPADGELLRVECFDDGSGAPAALVACPAAGKFIPRMALRCMNRLTQRLHKGRFVTWVTRSLW